MNPNYELSKSDEGHFILAPVLIPLQRDLQGDEISLEEVERACYRYNKSKRRVYKDHVQAFSEDEAEVVESYTAPADFYIGATKVSKGTWCVRFKVNQRIYELAKAGQVVGFSVSGQARIE